LHVNPRRKRRKGKEKKTFPTRLRQTTIYASSRKENGEINPMMR